ncbi:Wadjet anti-phage system protein JetD domain-containing protein [Pseudomonas sp. SCB32]|uniref:Wadjet anti-phage system protein JetD domain-containing protein n=1 Tax=Pseudomonas sp. SCB32 TaxID=2653853 RepID=UPI0012646B9B|nr:Wadjet anti-phage system protein JetD domain-containing protein [Pseudomonas sp. SCB32]
MKSPLEISRKLARQWYQSETRSKRLLGLSEWPLCIRIGAASAREFSQDPGAVQRHADAWKSVPVGTVKWEPVSYRAGAEPVPLPSQWCLRTPSEWIAATMDMAIGKEYADLEHIVECTDVTFRALLVTQRSLWIKKNPTEVIAAADLALRLEPGCAMGRPLRLLAEHGVDTKFFERNAGLLTRLLDERFQGVPSELGLTTFLGALEENEHWVLVAPLCDGLLPFKKLRLTTAELMESRLPGARLMVIENEKCLHQLPELDDTVAVLGCGLDLQWMAASWLREKQLAYWGDIDSWGLLMLSSAREFCPDISALLMSRDVYELYGSRSAVEEPVTAQAFPPSGLCSEEKDLYSDLLGLKKGRLEQEYLPSVAVEAAICQWIDRCSNDL